MFFYTKNIFILLNWQNTLKITLFNILENKSKNEFVNKFLNIQDNIITLKMPTNITKKNKVTEILMSRDLYLT